MKAFCSTKGMPRLLHFSNPLASFLDQKSLVDFLKLQQLRLSFLIFKFLLQALVFQKKILLLQLNVVFFGDQTDRLICWLLFLLGQFWTSDHRLVRGWGNWWSFSINWRGAGSPMKQRWIILQHSRTVVGVHIFWKVEKQSMRRVTRLYAIAIPHQFFFSSLMNIWVYNVIYLAKISLKNYFWFVNCDCFISANCWQHKLQFNKIIKEFPQSCEMLNHV